jgi:SagB-type dehydrogenase family enzyme
MIVIKRIMNTFLCLNFFSLLSFSWAQSSSVINLPAPKLKSNFSVEQALSERKSVRQYKNRNISLSQLAQILWTGQGITHDNHLRTAPSAGEIYPLKIYVLVQRVENLDKAIYQYEPKTHQLKKMAPFSMTMLDDAIMNQFWVKNAAMIFVIAAEFDKTQKKYNKQGISYVYIDTGHAAENMLLQSVALGVDAVPIAGFDGAKIKSKLKLINLYPVYMLIMG